MEWRKLILTYVQVQQPSTTNKHVYQLIISTIQTSTDVVFYPTPTDANYIYTYHLGDSSDWYNEFVLLDTVPEHVTTSLTGPRSVSWIHCNIVQWINYLVDRSVLGCCCRADDDHSRSKPIHPFYTR